MGVLPKALHSVDDSADEDQPWGSPDSGDVDVDVYAGLLRVFAGDLGDLYENGCKYYTFVPSTLSSKEWVIIKKLLQPCKTCQYERATKGICHMCITRPRLCFGKILRPHHRLGLLQ